MKLNDEHQKYYNKNDIEIPSVTTVLKILNKPELVSWANFMGSIGINSEEYTNKAAEVGTYVHYIIEKICKRKIIRLKYIDEDLDFKQQKKVRIAVESFKRFKKDYKPKFLYNELKLNNNKFGGTIDCICKINDENYIIDFKTSKKAYPSYFLQLAAYDILYSSKYKDNKIDKCGILVLDKKKARYDFTVTDIEHIRNYYAPIFLCLLEVYNDWRIILNDDWNEEL